MRIGFIGVGNMGAALAKAVSKASFENNIYVSDQNNQKVVEFCQSNRAEASDNGFICSNCDYIFLGVKPQMLNDLMISVSDILALRKNKPVLVSMAAGVKLESIQTALTADCPVIRIMPSIPVSVGQGVVLYCANTFVSESQIEDFKAIMSTVGLMDKLEEKLFDGASALSGCGPAFVAMFIESLADGAVACGLSRDKALKYAVQTVVGTAKYLEETCMHPSQFKDAVCSPAGSTIEGVKALEEGAFRSTVIDAVCSSYSRTKELGK